MYAVSLGAEVVVTFDADGQHRAEDIEKLLGPIFRGRYDVVIGNRFMGRTKMPFVRRMILRIASFIAYIMYGVKIGDPQSGLRAFSSYAAKKIKIDSAKMEHATEIIDEIVNKRLLFCEIPIKVRYTKYSLTRGQKNSNAIRQGLKIIVRSLLK